MKKIFGTALTLCALVFSSYSSAALVWTFEGSINTLWQGNQYEPATGALAQHYAAAGLGVGQAVQFTVLADFSRQGQKTNADGSTTVYQDLPPRCRCWDASGAFYDYAELLSSSIDFSTSSVLPGQESYNRLASYFSSTMKMTNESALLELGDFLTIYQGLWMAYDWSLALPADYATYSFTAYIDDGAGLVRASGTLRMVAVAHTPVPAAAWLMGSGLLGLAGLTRFKKKARRPC